MLDETIKLFSNIGQHLSISYLSEVERLVLNEFVVWWTIFMHLIIGYLQITNQIGRLLIFEGDNCDNCPSYALVNSARPFNVTFTSSSLILLSVIHDFNPNSKLYFIAIYTEGMMH